MTGGTVHPVHVVDISDFLIMDCQGIAIAGEEDDA